MKTLFVLFLCLCLSSTTGFALPCPSRIRLSRKTPSPKSIVKALPTFEDISNSALLLASDTSVQDFRQFAQGAAESFLQSLVIRTAIGMAASYVLGQIVSAGKEAFFKGQERIDSGEINLTSLYICIFLDLIGDTSYLLPGVGETEDLVWAPISAIVLSATLGSSAVGGFDFVKEALPFTDVLPVATLAWTLKNVYPESGLSKLLGLAPKKDSKER